MIQKKAGTKVELLRKIDEAEAQQNRADAEKDPVQQHLIEVGEIMKMIKPLPQREITVLLTPKGYDHSHFESKGIPFENVAGTLAVPSEKMDRVYVTHGGAYSSDGKTRYFYWDGKRLIDRFFTAALGEAGLIFNKPPKPASARSSRRK